jgi:hypothetical protein
VFISGEKMSGLLFKSYCEMIDINDEDLKDSSINLNIGTFILRNQIQGKFRSDVKSRLFPLRSYYWEVLNLKKRSRVIASFKNNKANLPFCLE